MTQPRISKTLLDRTASTVARSLYRGCRDIARRIIDGDLDGKVACVDRDKVEMAVFASIERRMGTEFAEEMSRGQLARLTRATENALVDQAIDDLWAIQHGSITPTKAEMIAIAATTKNFHRGRLASTRLHERCTERGLIA